MPLNAASERCTGLEPGLKTTFESGVKQKPKLLAHSLTAPKSGHMTKGAQMRMHHSVPAMQSTEESASTISGIAPQDSISGRSSACTTELKLEPSSAQVSLSFFMPTPESKPEREAKSEFTIKRQVTGAPSSLVPCLVRGFPLTWVECWHCGWKLRGVPPCDCSNCGMPN